MKNMEEKQRSANQIPDGHMKEKAGRNDEKLEKVVERRWWRRRRWARRQTPYMRRENSK